MQVFAPEEAHWLIRQAARLMTRDDEPLDPRAALLKIGGANEPDEAHVVPEMVAELGAAKVRIMQIEREAEARRVEIEVNKRQRQTLEAEQDAARAAEAAKCEKAQERATEALRRAEKAEIAIRQTKNLPGVRGRLVRWLAGNVLDV